MKIKHKLLLVLILTLACSIIFTYKIFNNSLYSQVIDAYNFNYGDDKDNNLYSIGGGFDNHVADTVVNIGSKRQYEFTMTSYDVFKPKVYLIMNYPSDFDKDIKSFSIEVFYFSRVKINSFELIDYKRSMINNVTFEEAVKLSQKYDISKDFKDKNKYDIVNYSDLSFEDIQKSKEAVTKQESLILNGQSSYLVNLRTGVEKRIYELNKEDKTIFDDLYRSGYFGDLERTDEIKIQENIKIWLDENYPETKIENQNN